VKEITLAKRYVYAALRTLSPEQHKEIYTQLSYLRNLIVDEPEIYKLLTSALIHKDKRLAMISSLMSDFADSKFWISFFDVLIEKNRANLIKTVLSEFENILNIEMNQKFVTLEMAHEPDEQTLQLIKTALENKLKSTVIIDVQINKEILGGFIAIADGHLIDASVLTSLKRFSSRRQKWQ